MEKDIFNEYVSKLSEPTDVSATIPIEETIDDNINDNDADGAIESKVEVSPESSLMAATVIVEIIDQAIPNTVGFVAKLNEEEKNSLHCDSDSKEAYTDVWAKYLQSKGAEMSPGLLLLLMTASIYGTKIPFALALKKQRLVETSENIQVVTEE
jgi:hypothetical protein